MPEQKLYDQHGLVVYRTDSGGPVIVLMTLSSSGMVRLRPAQWRAMIAAWTRIIEGMEHESDGS